MRAPDLAPINNVFEAMHEWALTTSYHYHFLIKFMVKNAKLSTNWHQLFD